MSKDIKKFGKFIKETGSEKIKRSLLKISMVYSANFNKSTTELNNGLCEDIAHDVIDDIGGESYNTFIIDDGFFWDTDVVSEYTTRSGEYWNIDNLKKYGDPPFEYRDLDKLDLTGHVWIYHNGKHYDVEALDGVENFWMLPIYIRQIAKLKLY